MTANSISHAPGTRSHSRSYVHSGGRIDIKEKYLASFRAGSLAYVLLRHNPLAVVREVGRNTVIVTGKATIEAETKPGQPLKRTFTTTTVYVRAAARLQLVSYQGTPCSRRNAAPETDA